MSSKIILQPAGDGDAQSHYVDTISHPVDLNRIKPFLPKDIFVDLQEIYPQGEAPVWGVTPGLRSVNKSKWDRIETGDITLFSKSGSIFASAVTTLKTWNKNLALDLWKTNTRGQTWEYVYFLDEIKKKHIPYIDFNKVAGYKLNNVIQGFNVLEEDRSAKIIEIFDLESKFYFPEVSKKKFEEALKDLSDDLVTDKKRQVAVRTEQGFLRGNLFRGKKIADCGICGRTLPINLLITAHIKPRFECSLEERKDYQNLIMPMCCLGCDELYERGYISIDKGKIITSALPHLPSDLKEYLNSIEGRSCSHWSETSKKYFDWHFKYKLS